MFFDHYAFLSASSECVLAGATGWSPLLGFEVAPGEVAGVADVPEAVDLGRVGTGGDVGVGEIDAVDGQAGQVPGVDEAPQVAGLPAEATGAVPDEGRGDGGGDRAAGGAAAGGRSGCGRAAAGGGDGGRGAG